MVWSSARFLVPSANVHHLIGRTIDGRFQVVRLLGQGGMGAVFEAIQLQLDRRCALKVLLPSAFEVPMAKPRFLREARLAARIHHPNVVDVVDTGTDSDGISYIAMEYIVGESLDKTLEREGTLPWERARHIILQVCRALESAHASGVIHRDLKPANCMRMMFNGDPDFIKIVDFGIAKALQEPEKQTKLTQANTPIGTVDYMAYEQAFGVDDCDGRVDVWSVGVILYELVSGCLPFRGAQVASPLQRLAAILHREATPLTSRVEMGTIPAKLPEVVHKALLKDRDARFASIAELRGAIEALPATVEQPLAAIAGAGQAKELSGPTEIDPAAVISLHSGQIADSAETSLPRGESVVMLASLQLSAPAQPIAPASAVAIARSAPKGPSVRMLALLALVMSSILLTMIIPPLFQREPATVARESTRSEAAPGVTEPPAPPNEPLAMATPEMAAQPQLHTQQPEPSSMQPEIPAPQPDTSPVPASAPQADDRPVEAKPKATPAPARKSPQQTGPQACTSLQKRLAKAIAQCLDGRSQRYALKVDVDPRGVVTDVSIKSTLLKKDEGYKCLAAAFRGQRIMNVGPQMTSFDCQVPAS